MTIVGVMSLAFSCVISISMWLLTSYLLMIFKSLSKTKLERNRVALRKMVAQKVGTADGAIAVFVDEDNEQWRFSFIAIEYEFVEKGFEKKHAKPLGFVRVWCWV
jgi:phage pi2 protein 07